MPSEEKDRYNHYSIGVLSMKSFKLLAFMALVGIGQTMICGEKKWSEEQHEYAQRLQKRLDQMVQDRAPRTTVGFVGLLLSSTKQQELASATYGDLCNILHQEEFQHCPNTIFAKFRSTAECVVVKDYIAASLEYNPQMPDAVERYQKSRERFYAAKKAAQ